MKSKDKSNGLLVMNELLPEMTKYYNEEQMKEIKLAILHNIDMSRYIDFTLTANQLKYIRLGLENDLDVSIYADHTKSEDVMRESFNCLMMGVPDIRLIAGKHKNVIKEVQRALRYGTDVMAYGLLGLNSYQMKEIRKALNEGLDISRYISGKYSAYQLEEIFNGIRKNLNISLYDNPDLEYKNMSEIRKGLTQNVDMSTFTSPLYNIIQLKEIRKSLVAGVDLTNVSPDTDALSILLVRVLQGYGIETVEDIYKMKYTSDEINDIEKVASKISTKNRKEAKKKKKSEKHISK